MIRTGFEPSSTASFPAAQRFAPSTSALASVNGCFFSHISAEPGYRAILAALDGESILDLQMRLGEASGGAAWPS